MALSFEPLSHKGFLTREVWQHFHSSSTSWARSGFLDCFV